MGIEKESWTTTGVVEGEMRKRKAWKFLISSWVVIDMADPHENRKQFKLPSPLGPANFRPRLSNQRISTLFFPSYLFIYLYMSPCEGKLFDWNYMYDEIQRINMLKDR